MVRPMEKSDLKLTGLFEAENRESENKKVCNMLNGNNLPAMLNFGKRWIYWECSVFFKSKSKQRTLPVNRVSVLDQGNGVLAVLLTVIRKHTFSFSGSHELKIC